MALTTREWGDRLLGKNLHLRLPQESTWIANGNNIQLGGDIPRRCYPINLDAKMSRPWKRSAFKHPDLEDWVLEERGRIIWAALVLIMAWVSAGSPEDSVKVLGGFKQWSTIVGNILKNAGIVGFLENLDKMYDTADVEGQQWESFLLEVYACFGDKWFSTYELCEQIGLRQSLENALPEELGAPFTFQREIDGSFKIKLGKKLKNKK